MHSLRILHVVFSSRIAGSERYCIDLANRQAAEGHVVHVAGMTRSRIARELAPAVKFHAFASPFFRAWKLRRLAAALRIDVCHGHLSAGCKALRKMPPPHRTIATLHVGYKAHQHDAMDAVICVNHAQAKRVGNYGGVVRTIPNWLPQRPTRVAARGLRAELGIADDAFVIAAVGRLHRSKGMDVLVAAFRQAAPATAKLVIFGEGPERGHLLRLAEGDARIVLPGYRGDVRDCLSEVDLFVSPSREESFGLAIIEAMEMGLPIVTTSADGPAEFLRDHPVVFVRPGSVSALATTIAEVHALFSEGELPRLEYDLAKFDAAAGIGRISELYRETIRMPHQDTLQPHHGVAVPV